MEISPIETVNQRIHDYVEYVFKDYTSRVTCPLNIENYKEWFIQDFLQACITRWYDSSCYDINNTYTIEQFFDNSVYLYSDILQILTDYFDNYGKTMDMNKFDPKNVMRCYTSVYVCNNVDYFLDKYQYEYEDDISNSRSEASEIISIDLFQSDLVETSTPHVQPDLVENTIEDNEENNDNNNSTSPPMFVNIVGYDNTDEEDNQNDSDNENSSLPGLINIDDDSDTASLPELLNDGDEEYGFFETGVFVTENEFNEKNKNVDCIICWDVVMSYGNSMKWNNCDHFSCISCHDTCMLKKLYKCPLCRS